QWNTHHFKGGPTMRRIAQLSLISSLLSCASFLVAAEKPAPTGRMVSIELVIAQFPDGQKDLDLAQESGDKLLTRVKELEKQGQFTRMTRMRLSTLDQNQAMLQLGERAPVASGRTRAAFGGRGGQGGVAGAPVVNTTYTIENVGTMIGVTPQVEDDGSVSLNMQIEKTHLIPPPAAGDVAAGEPAEVPPSRTATLTTRSTVRVRSGQTTLVG